MCAYQKVRRLTNKCTASSCINPQQDQQTAADNPSCMMQCYALGAVLHHMVRVWLAGTDPAMHGEGAHTLPTCHNKPCRTAPRLRHVTQYSILHQHCQPQQQRHPCPTYCTHRQHHCAHHISSLATLWNPKQQPPSKLLKQLLPAVRV